MNHPTRGHHPRLFRLARAVLPPAALLARAVLPAAALLAGCENTGTPNGTGDAVDAASYFPVEAGRYWIYFDPDSRFLTLEFTGTKTVNGLETTVLTYTFDVDTTSSDAPGPAYEQYFVNDPDAGVLLYGYKDYLQGTSGTYLPGVVFAGAEVDIGDPVDTATADSGKLASFTATVLEQGVVQTYFGDFEDGIDLTFGPSDGEQSKHFLARDKGMVKFDWLGTRFQLYDYGVR
jgi:hypothetical protein